MEIYAHRGWSGVYPENTLMAFRMALASGAHGIELDVHATADGVPVVIHDRSLSRTTAGSGNVDELSLADIRTLDAGSGERIPTLREVLELVGIHAHFDIEVKGSGIEAEVLAVLARSPNTRWAISSFDWGTLRRLRELDSAAELWPLAMECDAALFAVANELGAPVVSLALSDYTAPNATALRHSGLKAMIWTVNEAAEAKRIRDLGAFALCTDHPDRIAAALMR